MNRRDFLKTTGAVGMAVMLGAAGLRCTREPDRGRIALPPLPYPPEALAPHLSARTLEFHHGKHHNGYVNKVNRLIGGTPYSRMPLVQIVAAARKKPEHADIFNNAAQVYNHTIFWNSMAPDGGGDPPEELKTRLTRFFGSMQKFRGAFRRAADSVFGSGWVWLARDGERLAIIPTGNADTPLARGKQPLLALDLWEHAYYLDYQNRRGDYVDAFLTHLIDWDFALRQFKSYQT